MFQFNLPQALVEFLKKAASYNDSRQPTYLTRYISFPPLVPIVPTLLSQNRFLHSSRRLFHLLFTVVRLHTTMGTADMSSPVTMDTATIYHLL